MKRGFGIITAIIILVLVATLGSMILSYSASSVKQAGDDYLRLQAELLVKSAQEFAILRIGGFDRSGGCLEQLDIDVNLSGSQPLFDVNVTIFYILDSAFVGCSHVLNAGAYNIDSDSNGTAIIDVVVTTKDGVATEPMSVHHRMIQKP